MAKTVFYIVTCVMERTTVRMDQMKWAAVSFLKQNQLFLITDVMFWCTFSFWLCNAFYCFVSILVTVFNV